MIEKRTSKYNKKGMYAGYDKNHKERNKLDYYSTPTEEVENILNTMHLDLDRTTILEPCCGGGHMVQGIANYCYNNYDSKLWKIKATDIAKRDSVLKDCDWEAGDTFDFLSDAYPYTQNIDYIIMNPPFKLIEPFCMKALGIAKRGVLMFGRIQFLEGIGRYEMINKNFPPTDVYVYVDRVCCYPNGNTSEKPATIQCYAWFYWDIGLIDTDIEYNTTLHWIRKANKE
jgi:hypothetical protein